jgi:uncharacterized protein (TIGR03437 family)
MLRARLILLPFCFALLLCLPGLYLAGSQPGQLRRITETSESTLNLNPSLSGDGSHLAFESTADLAGTRGRSGFHALLSDLADAQPSFKEMSATRAVSPAISQDGSRVVFASNGDPLGTNSDGNSEIFLYDGATLLQLTDTLPGDLSQRLAEGNFNPSMTDDGSLIAFSSNRHLTHTNANNNLQIFLYDTRAQSFTQLTNAPGPTTETDAKLSGDGSRIAYLRTDDANPEAPRELLLYDRASQTTRVIAHYQQGLALAYGRAISDDGTRIVYAAETIAGTATDHASQVFLYDATRNQTRQITHLDARGADVPLHQTISGDGSRIAFATRRNVLGGKTDNSAELYLFDIPTNELTQVTAASAAANAPVVSSLNDDGSIIAFNFPRVLSGPVSSAEYANNSEIYTAHIAARPPFADDLRISNAASLGNEPATRKSVAPGSMAVAYGGALAFLTEQATREPLGSFPYSLDGTTVAVNGQPAQLFFVSPEQVNFQVPPQTTIGPAEFVVTNAEGFQTRGTIEITRAAPGLFTLDGDGRGMALALDALTMQTGPFDPTQGTGRIILFATGSHLGSQIQAAFNGFKVAVEAVQSSTDLPGLDEIHLLLPANLRGAGTVLLSLRVDERESNPVLLTLTGEARRDIVINELLADPPEGIEGDANRDGTRSASQDEFIELVNTTEHDIDVGGYQILTRTTAFSDDTLRHTFAQGAIMPAGTAILIFGGANRANFNPQDPAFGGAQVFTSSKGGLSLINSGSIVTLQEPAGAIEDQLSYGGASGLKGDANQSLTRSPDTTGQFSLHKAAEGNAGRAFSPGTRVDGSPFNYSKLIARIQVSPATANIITGAQQQFVARAFDAFGNELSGIIFRWQSSAAAVATIEQDGSATGIAEGTTEIRASARGIESAPSPLTVRPREHILTHISVNPSSITINVGGTQQFTARAFDQDEQELKAVTFNWTSNSPAIATIDEHGLATSLMPGSTLITATARNVSGSATLKVVTPPIIINELLADPPDGIAGDANQDGVRSGTDDEFIEIVNSSNAALDISGWTIRTKSFTNGANEISRHTFARGTTLPASDAIVVFGGGAFDAQATVFGGAQITKASGNSLSLTNSGLEIVIRDDTGGFVTRFAYGTPGDDLGGDSVNQSITRFPDISGPFMRHSAASGQPVKLFSPGTKVDGSFFAPRAGQLTRVTLTTAAASIFVDQSTIFTAQALDQYNRPLQGVALAFASDNPGVADVSRIDPDTGAGRADATIVGHSAGMTRIIATGILDQKTIASEAINLMVQPAPPRIASVLMRPISASINRGNIQQFTATALDQNNGVVEGAVFAWTSSDTHVAGINSSGLASGDGIGETTITASVSDGAGGTVSETATLHVEMPLIINELLADVPPDNSETVGLVEGDANRDGTRNAGDDEFIELLNNSHAMLDLSGVRIFDSGSTNPRFTFPANTTLAAGRALLIFGGGSPPINDTAFGGALVLTVANSATPSGTLSLNDGGDSISLRLIVGDNDVTIASLTYGTGGPISAPTDQSLTRAPDAEINSAGGNFIAHAAAFNAAGRVYSPGTRSDGTPFGSTAVTRIEITPATIAINAGATQTFTARAFSNTGGQETEVPFVSFIWDTTDASRATLAPITGPAIIATAISTGATTIHARAGGQQALATLTINPPPPVLTSIRLTPASASVVEGHSTQFTAQALDQFDQPMTGTNISFTSSDTGIATIDSVIQDASKGLAEATVTGHNIGTAHIIANAMDAARSVMSQPSDLEVKPAPPVVKRISVTPSNASIGVGQTRQFTAQAFDQNEQPIAGVIFTWSSGNMSVASINQDGLATALSAGTTQVMASADNVNSDPAALNVTAPPIPAEGQVIINEALVSFATSGTQTRRDFLELYNRTNQTLDISGLVISFRPSGSSNTPGALTLPGANESGATLIQPNGYFLIVNGADTFGVLADFEANAFDLNNTTGGIKLEIGGVKLDGLSYQGGSAAPAAPFNSYGEGPVFVFTSGTTNDIIRSPNAMDSGNNANDFRRNGTANSVSPRAANPTLP